MRDGRPGCLKHISRQLYFFFSVESSGNQRTVSFKKNFEWLKQQLRKKPFNISNWVTERPTLWENNLPAYLVHMDLKRDIIIPGPFISESRVYNLQFQAESE